MRWATFAVPCFAAALLIVPPSSCRAAIIVANSGFAGNYVTFYDNATDTSSSIWSGTSSLGSIAYDGQQDDAYFTYAFSTRDRLMRDVSPADAAGGLEIVRDFGGGASDVFAFRGLDMASDSRVVYAWANSNGSSAASARVARVELLDTDTGGITTLFSGSDLNTDLRDVAVDPTSSWAYVSDSFQDRIFRVSTDGTSQQGVLSGLTNPGALDIVGDSLYWAESEFADSAWTSSIWRSNLAGEGATSLLTVDYRINDLAVGDGRIYWTEADRAPVKFRGLSGGTIQELGGNAAQGNLVALANANAIPEPSAIPILAGFALCLGVGGWWRRRKQI
jgi:hypothetical protein